MFQEGRLLVKVICSLLSLECGLVPRLHLEVKSYEQAKQQVDNCTYQGDWN